MKQIGLPLHGRPILLIIRMITDRIGLHSVLLPLVICHVNSNLPFKFWQVLKVQDLACTHAMLMHRILMVKIKGKV